MPLIRPRARRILQPAIYGAVLSGGGVVLFDAISNGTPALNAASISWTHTPTGTPTAVAVLLAGYSGSGLPTACTYGGVAMVAGTFFGANAASGARIFGLANPPAGAQIVSATGGAGAYMIGVAITVTGSDTATCFRNSSGGSGTGAASTATVVSAAGDLVIDCVGGFASGAAPSGVGAGQTSRYTAFFNGNVAGAVSTSPGAASVTDTWSTVNSGGTNTWAAAIAAFQHA